MDRATLFPRPARLTVLTALLLTACSAPQTGSEGVYQVPFQRVESGTSTDLDSDRGGSANSLSTKITTDTLSLQQTIDLVLERNPGLGVAAARIQQADSAFAESQAAFRPQVNLDLGYLRADAPSTYLFKTIDARGYVPGTDFNNPGAFNNWEAGVGVGYNLYSGGSHQLAGDIAQLQQRIAQLGVSTLHNQLTAMTIDLWFSALVATEQLQVAESSVQTVTAQLSEAQTLYEEGKVLRSDVLTLQVRLAAANEIVIRSGNGVQMARIGLASLLAMAEQEMPPLENDINPLPNMEEPTDLAAALASAFEQRPELEQLRFSLAQGQLQIERAESSSKPSVDLFGRAWADNPDIDFAGSEANWTVGIAASWNLFDGGAQSARAARAKAQLAEVHARHRALLAEVRMDVELAYLAYGESSARLDVARGAVDLALESLRLVQVQYEGGAATITRYLEAEQMATNARQRLNQAVFDRKRAAADLARAMGSFAQA